MTRVLIVVYPRYHPEKRLEREVHLPDAPATDKATMLEVEVVPGIWLRPTRVRLPCESNKPAEYHFDRTAEPEFGQIAAAWESLL